MLSNVDKMIDRVPQPQMLGGKRERKFVLPGHSEYDYAERSLAVNGSHDKSLWDDEGGNTEELGGKISKKFWKDFGHGFKQGFTETMKVGLPIVMGMGRKGKISGQTLHQEGGAVWEGEDGSVHSTPRRRGGKANKAVNTFKKIGRELKPVIKELKPVAKKFVKEVVIPEGIKMAKSYLAGPEAVSSGRRRGRKPRVPDYESESDEEEGGALISNHPRQFHSKSYPKGLASYHPKGGSSGGKRGSARGAIVSKVMREKGMSLPEASRYVKEKGLYKP